jgi:hypothetical protein
MRAVRGVSRKFVCKFTFKSFKNIFTDRPIVEDVYSVSQEEISIFWEAIISVILSKKVYMYMCPIPNGFRDRVISLYSSITVDKKDINVLFLIKKGTVVPVLN